MLILTRKCGESLVINNEIELKITEISGDKVKIGIEAPKDYKILRKELCQTVENNRAAALGTMPDEMLKLIAKIQE